MSRRWQSILLCVFLAGCDCSASVGPRDAGRHDTGLADASAVDGDGDGIPDGEEGRFAPGGSVDSDMDGTPDYQDPDSDGDGIPDWVEGGERPDGVPPFDSDNDGTPDFQDGDSDADTIPDSVEGVDLVDTDEDGVPDYLDRDSDADGLFDSVDGVMDSDGDGIADYRERDADGDAMEDGAEGVEDWDGDGSPNYRDGRNDGAVPPITLTAISTPFNSPIGIDYHEPTRSVVVSVNYSAGLPLNFERIQMDGSHEPFSTYSGLTDEVKIATARSGNPAGFPVGDLFVGNGIDGQIARVSADGTMIVNPWVDLPGDANGLMRGSLYVDRTGVFGGDLIVATTTGEVWRITIDGVPTRLAAVGVHLEGMIVVPNAPFRYGPLAGHIIAGAEGSGLLYAFDTAGTVTTYNVGVAIEDIDLVTINENFFGVNFGTSVLLGAPASEFRSMVGDVLLAQETHSGTGLYLLRWDGTALSALEIPRTAASAPVGQWEHVTFAGAGIVEIPPPI